MTKIKNIPYKNLEMQKYLESENIAIHRKKIIFKTRTHMLNVNYNYGQKILCPLCQNEDDRQTHLTKCRTMIESIPTIQSNNVDFLDAYDEKDLDKANKLSIVIEKVLQRRSVILDSRKIT